MDEYTPPFHITDKIVNLVAEISEQAARISVESQGTLSPHLRRTNRIRTIHSSLAIESNTLSLEEVTAILDGKRVLGNPNEIREVKNAYDAYEMMLTLDPCSTTDLLAAHRAMTAGLIPESGQFRSGNVGVVKGEEVLHMAPPSALVPEEIEKLLQWYKKSQIHPLIRSAIFHYEFEFIHPFADCNGRVGRMWHSLLLGRWKELFYWLPVEDMIRARQQEYYDAFRRSGKAADSAPFVEFMLEIILDSISDITVVGRAKPPVSVQKILNALGDDTLSAVEIMNRMGLSHKGTFRKNYLLPALKENYIEMTIPDKPNSRNQKYRKRLRWLSKDTDQDGGLATD